MIVYKVFTKDYEHEKIALLGMLAERRKGLRGKTRMEAGLDWAKAAFGGSASDKDSIFVVPKELEVGHATRVLMKRTIFYKDELLDMVDPLALSQRKQILAKGADTKEPASVDLLPDDLLNIIGEATSYSQFYGFSEKPFEVVPDPQFFYSSPSHLSVLTSVINGIENRENLVCVTGEVGTGKTTFVHFLLHCLEEKVKTALIAYPSNTFEELVSNLLVSLDQVVEEDTKQALLDQLNGYLTEKMDKDKTLPSEVMEELGTFYEGGRWVARLQMILVGAPELMHKINTPRLKQFGREIGVRCEISPLTDEESKKYIDHRLKLVGSRSREIFTPEALSMIVRHARGFPRVINILCDNAFMIGYGLSKTRIDEDMVRQAIKDMEAPTQQKLIPRRIVRAVKENRLVSQVMSFFREKFLSSFYH